jgi:ApbE superfamily uncharacterized protein (UPF0280 family)
MMLRITGPPELYEEARAAGMQFWEQLQSYAIRNPMFQSSKRPIYVPQDAPRMVQRMAELSMRAGVGPMFTYRGALTEYVGRIVARSVPELFVTCGADHFVVAKKRARLSVHRAAASGHGGLAVVVKPELGAHGIHSSIGGGSSSDRPDDGVVVVATSCILADAAAAGAGAILAKGRRGSIRTALSYLGGLEGVHGAIVVRGERIGVAGGLELAA